MVIGHDKKGRGKGWFCERVSVMYSAEANTQTVLPCSQWFDTGALIRELRLYKHFVNKHGRVDTG